MAHMFWLILPLRLLQVNDADVPLLLARGCWVQKSIDIFQQFESLVLDISVFSLGAFYLQGGCGRSRMNIKGHS